MNWRSSWGRFHFLDTVAYSACLPLCLYKRSIYYIYNIIERCGDSIVLHRACYSQVRSVSFNFDTLVFNWYQQVINTTVSLWQLTNQLLARADPTSAKPCTRPCCHISVCKRALWHTDAVAQSGLNSTGRGYGGWFRHGLLYNLYRCQAIRLQPGGTFHFPEASTDVSYMKLIHSGFCTWQTVGFNSVAASQLPMNTNICIIQLPQRIQFVFVLNQLSICRTVWLLLKKNRPLASKLSINKLSKAILTQLCCGDV